MIRHPAPIAKALGFLIIMAMPFFVIAQNPATQVSLTDLSAFKDPPANWSIAGSVKGDFNKDNYIGKDAGQGILVNDPSQKKNEDIFTNFEHGDIDLDVDFMMPRGSNSGIYLQGRYEIQLLDSWGKDVVTAEDLGGVYPRWDETRTNGFAYDGIAPGVNVSRAPGLWQNIKISFLAPKFDAAGNKTANARIVKIILNGVTIMENVELTGPTRGSAFPAEGPMGPLRLQGDHGAVAFKNIKYSTTPTNHPFADKAPKPSDIDRPVFVEVKDEPVVLRSFVHLGNKMITHAVSVGYQHGLNFSYDLGNGSLFRVWRGGFVDATPMWWFRGDGTTRALGSVIPFNNAPQLTVINGEGDVWPDTLTDVQGYRAKGYELDGKGIPTFKYILGDLHIDDKIAPSDDGKTLTRQVTLTGTAPANLYYRVALANDITTLGDGMYSINNFEYYIRLTDKVKPRIRVTAAGTELLLPVTDASNGATVNYSIIW